MKLISLLPINLREAEDEEGGGEEAGANPFAAASGEGGEEGEAEGGEGDAEADAGAEGGAEEGGEEGGESSEELKPLEVSFDPSKVRKYNDLTFNGNKGTVTNVSRFGISVKLPDEKTVFVNFTDIL